MKVLYKEFNDKEKTTMKLQEHFVRSVRLYFKSEGDKWLQNLPSTIHYCEDKWSLKMKEPFALSINYVAPALTATGDEVVVKICIPGEECLNELEALQLFGEERMVRLIRSDKEKGILILERLSPGEMLVEINNDEEACIIAANVIKNITIPVPPLCKLPTTQAREEELSKMVQEHKNGIGPISHQTLHRALRVFTYMNKTIKQYWLLHGDFHHYNILSSGRGEWKVIDPKGLIGEVEYDLIQYMLNNLPNDHSFEVIEKRVDIFTNKLNLNRKRLLLWGYCHTVLATAWTVGEDGAYNESFYRGIEIFKKLYEKEPGKIS